jgi:hypothetical protein
MPVDLLDALDAFGRSVVEAVPGAEYAGISVRTGACPEWFVWFRVAGTAYKIHHDPVAGAELLTPHGSVAYRDGDWRALLSERFGGGA